MASVLHALVARVDENDDENVGSARTAPASLSGLVTTLVPTLLTFAVFTALFLVLRPRVARQYAPRTYLGSLGEFERTPKQSPGMFGWLKDMYNLPDTFVLQHNSLDGYFLLRYLKIATIICFVGCLITFPVLFPINATGGGGQKQLDLISFSNVTNTKNRYYAHTFCAWIFIGFVFFMITRESLYYINLRQAYLLSPLYASRISSRTVLFSSVPDNYLNEQRIRTMFGDKLKNLWIPTDVKDLEEKVKERDKVSLKLEGAEIKLIELANQARLKSAKKGHSPDAAPRIENDVEAEPGAAAARWIKPKQRPTHRLKPIIGKKVDTINWSRTELERLIPEIREEQHLHRVGDPKFINSVFVEFYNQTEAQAAYQMVAHHQPLHMAPRTIGFTPGEIIWSNLRIRWWERVIRNISTIAAVCVTIIFWSIPVAFIGTLSNITSLTKQKGLEWLGFINDVPSWIRGVITGLLPVILMAVLFALLPIYLRLMARLGGLPTLSTVELRTQNFYFWFQVIQVFLVTTLTSAASASFSSIFKDPSSATTLLAENIPKASNFYISYFILQGLTFSSGALLQLVGLILGKVLGKVLDTSPRKMYTRWSTLSSLGWGTIFPIISNLTVISITYSCIAPLVLGFATLGLYLFYFAYRYNLLFVNSSNIDTKGLVYVQALQHTTVGCYLSCLCLIGLFAIRTAIGPLILMIVFLIFIILYHVSLTAAIGPLLYYLPKSLEAEEEALMAADRGNSPTVLEATPEPKKQSGVREAGTSNGTSSPGDAANEKGAFASPPPHQKPGMLAKFLRPDKYTDYATMRRLVPMELELGYTPEVEKNAYYNPAVKSEPPLLWIPRDEMGISRQEVSHTGKVLPITDEGAHFDEKGKIVWDLEGTNGRPPIWEAKTYY
ncbi:MAG: hypothetical protein Q9160_000652 [Pyrenula sp. 1 TL-2023]